MMQQERKKVRLVVIWMVALSIIVGSIQPAAAQYLQNVQIIKAIEIRGNKYIDTATIQKAITKTKVNSQLVEKNISDDLEAIYALGYFYDIIPQAELMQDGGIKIIFNVVENPVVKNIIIEGATEVPVQDYVKEMKQKVGEVLNVPKLMEDIENLGPWVSDNYHVILSPLSLEIIDDGIIKITVAEATIQEIRLEGNEKTKDHVILRELSFGPGDVLNFSVVNKDLIDVLMLGFFEEINYSIEEGDEPNKVILVIQLTERKTGSADFGAGYSSKNGLFGYVDISDDNFLGNGQRANVFFEIGKGTRTYKLGFYEPYITQRGTSFGFNIYNIHEDVKLSYDDTDEPVSGTQHQLGGDITIGHPLGEDTRGSLTLSAKNFRYSGDLEEREEPYRLLTLGGAIVTNTTNHPFNPTQGFKNNIYLETGFTFKQQNSTYSKITIEHSRYYKVFRDDVIFAIRGLGGRTLSGELPKSEFFMLGGSDTLRGYNYGGEGLVGDKMILVNSELRFPIYDFISGVAFFDIGKAWESDERMDLTELLNSYGLGIRVDTPLGLLRLDYGWGLNSENKRDGQFYFGIGHTF